MKKFWKQLKALILKYDKHFFEFLLLFAAVFSGFLADNYRESLEKRKVERHIISDIINDLNADIELAEKVKLDLTTRSLTMDTLLEDFDVVLHGSVKQFLHYRSSYTGWEDYFQSTSGFDQLKNGGYALIKSNDILDSIVQYNAIQNDIRGEISNLERHVYILWDTDDALFSRYQVNKLKELEADLNNISVQDILMPEQRTAFYTHKYYARLGVVEGNFRHQIRLHTNSTIKARNLIAFLKNEYEM